MARATTTTKARASARPARSRALSALPPPAFRPVQLAALVDTVPTGDRWLHEMKYDGYRLLVSVGGGRARAYTRSGLDWSAAVYSGPPRKANSKQRVSDCVRSQA